MPVVLTATVMALLMVVIVGTVPEQADAATRFKKVIKDFRNPKEIVIPTAGHVAGSAAS